MSGLPGAALAMILVLALVSGLQFRRGARPLFRTRESGIRWHRDASLPLIWRRIPILVQLPAAGFLPGAVFLALRAYVQLPARLAALLPVAGLAGLLLGVGLMSILAFAPARWVVPQWLAEEDRRAGYVAPPPDRFDWLTLALFGGIGTALGIGALALAVLVLVSHFSG